MNALLDTLSGLLDLVAPPRCLGCDDLLREEEPTRLHFCEACGPLIEVAKRGVGVFVYGGPIADALRAYKYSGRWEHGRALASMLSEHVDRLHVGRVDLVVPIAPHSSRVRERGFDPVVPFARVASRSLGVPLDLDALRRVRPTRKQAGLSLEARGFNVKGAFEARSKKIPGARVLLIDDVCTTGATMKAAREALSKAGASSVRLLAFAAVDHNAS